MFGEMGEETLLGGQRVMPRQLQESGFEFEYPALDEALAHELNTA
jgi:NAD dependent epimerase/dehydratase family enzyme